MEIPRVLATISHLSGCGSHGHRRGVSMELGSPIWRLGSFDFSKRNILLSQANGNQSSSRIRPESNDSQRLFSLARDGDDSALWRVTEQFRPYLKALVRRNLGPQLAGKVDDSDIVQQSMIRAVNKFPDFEGMHLGQWQAWLVTIVQNETRNTMRYWHQQRRDAKLESAPPNGSQRNWDPSDHGSTPSGAAMRRERAARLVATIQQLPDDQQQLIHWRHFENLAHKEIATRLGISEAATRQRWKSVLEKLNKLWEKEQESEKDV